jgi:hypothetical protein
VNILNKQWHTNDKGGPPGWELGLGLTTPHRKNKLLMKSHKELRIFTDYLEGKRPLGRPRRKWIDNIKMDWVVWTGLVWLRIDTGGELL